MNYEEEYKCFDVEFKAVEASIINQDIETIKIILQARTDLSSLINSVGETLIHLAVNHRRIDLIHWLLQNDVNVNIVDFAKKTGLHLAVSLKFFDIVEFLLNNNAKIDAKDCYGTSPFHLAVLGGNISIIESFLTHGANVVDVTLKNQETCFHLALKNENYEVFDLLFQYYEGSMDLSNIYGESILHLLVMKNSRHLIKELLATNVNLETINHEDDTPLHIATQRRNLWIVELLLEHGANVNVKNKYDEHPLHIAIRNKDADIVKLLLSYGADPKTLSTNKNSAFHLVMNYYDDEVFEILLGLDLDIDANNGDNYTPFHLAIANRNEFAAVIFLSKGANINSMSSKTWINYQQFNRMNWAQYRNLSPLHTAIVLKDINLVNFLLDNDAKVDFENQTETFLAIDVGSCEILETLFEHGVDLNKRNKEGESLLFRAVQYCNIRLVHTLLSKGANIKDIFAMDKLDVPALHIAVKCHQDKFVKFLLELGVDVNAFDVRKRTALQYAGESSISITEALIKYMAVIKLNNGFINEQNQSMLDTSPRCTSYYAKCVVELNKLENYKCRDIPLLFFLQKNAVSLAKLLKNKDIFYEFVGVVTLQRFPIYFQMLICKMLDASKRKQLVKKVKKIFNLIGCFESIYDVIDKIIDNFSMRELEQFVERYKISKYGKKNVRQKLKFKVFGK